MYKFGSTLQCKYGFSLSHIDSVPWFLQAVVLGYVGFHGLIALDLLTTTHDGTASSVRGAI